MNVFAYWDSTDDAPPRQAELMTLWEQSWRARGWEPRLLTKDMARKHPLFKTAENPNFRSLALMAAKGHWICPVHLINFSFIPPRPPAVPRILQFSYGRPGWKTSPLVDFGHGATARDILDCERNLLI